MNIHVSEFVVVGSVLFTLSEARPQKSPNIIHTAGLDRKDSA